MVRNSIVNSNKMISNNTMYKFTLDVYMTLSIFCIINNLQHDFHGFIMINLINKFRSDQQTNMDSTKSDKTSAEDAKIKSDLFKLVEKLRIEMNKKDEELAKEKQKNQKLSTDLEKEKARANRADELETELASAQEINHVFQISLCFLLIPSRNLS